MSESCDVLVIGGGPAGSTAAALLAAAGRRVTLLEKERHPRFHIGESLLPMNLPLFEALGVSEAVRQIGIVKYGAEFVSPAHAHSSTFEFARALDRSHPFAYQVRRSEFDLVLLDNARAKGAQVVEECKVEAVDFEAGGASIVHAVDAAGVAHIWRCRFLLDATGRDTFLASRLHLKEPDRRHASAAIFGHFTGARRLPGKAEGNITVFWFEHGWFWFIPLADGTTSVGAVCRPHYLKRREGDVSQFLLDTVALCPALAERLAAATLTGPASATGNYSYRARAMSGPGYLMLGDAYAFIDPVFSTGVYLAMSSAFRGAAAVATCLDHPEQEARARAAFERDVRRGIDTFSWYIYRVTAPAMRALFMGPRNVLRVEEAMLSLLAGDVFRPSSVRWRLCIFKAIFYMQGALLALASRLAQVRRRPSNAV